MIIMHNHGLSKGCDDDEMKNYMLPPKKCSKNAQVKIRESEENEFVSNELDEDVYIEMKFDK